MITSTADLSRLETNALSRLKGGVTKGVDRQFTQPAEAGFFAAWSDRRPAGLPFVQEQSPTSPGRPLSSQSGKGSGPLDSCRKSLFLGANPRLLTPFRTVAYWHHQATATNP